MQAMPDSQTQCRVSVIVPVYNVAPYVARCIRSIQTQSFADFECLIVDDASPDDSIAVIEPIVAGDPRFRILRHERNQGLGPARNTGIAAASAEFVCFIDSDDYVERDYLELLYETAIRHQAPIVACGSKTIEVDGREQLHVENVEAGYKLTGTNISKIVSLGVNPGRPAWGRIYEKRLFDRCRFPTGLSEDTGTNIVLLLGSDISFIPFINKPLYNYVRRQGAITLVWDRRRIDDYCDNTIGMVLRDMVKRMPVNRRLVKACHVFALHRVTWFATRVFMESNQPVRDMLYLQGVLKRSVPAELRGSLIWSALSGLVIFRHEMSVRKTLVAAIIHFMAFKCGRAGITLLALLIRVREGTREKARKALRRD